MDSLHAVRRRCRHGLLLLLLAGCATLPERGPIDYSAALAPGQTTVLDRAELVYEEAHPGRSGFQLLGEGAYAFAVRALLSGQAERSLDIQTYIWHDDLTGRYLAWVLLQVADRGVRVRLLLDDLDSRAKNDALVALDHHPFIEVRLYNPAATRHGTLALVGEGTYSFVRLNQRMHIKNWIIDNRIAIAGGRNVGNEYFAAGEGANFADVDYVMAGPVVREASQAFDLFWNSGRVFPVALLNPEKLEKADLKRVRGLLDQAAEETLRSPYAEALQRDKTIDDLFARGVNLVWESDYWLVCDDPDKSAIEESSERSAVLRKLRPAVMAAQREVVIISPYFVPGEGGTAALIELARRGVAVYVLTNSLAANDVAAVHGGYARYRKELLDGGVKLWELKPSQGKGSQMPKLSLLGSSGASLHAKSLAIDGKGLFVGSYNLDPRSTRLNAEMGIYVESPVLVQRLLRDFPRRSIDDVAWRVTLEEGELRWSDGEQVLKAEPDASWWRRFQAWVASVLPIEPLL